MKNVQVNLKNHIPSSLSLICERVNIVQVSREKLIQNWHKGRKEACFVFIAFIFLLSRSKK